MPESFGDFPSSSNMLKYLQSYANHFSLKKHIQFETPVLQVEPLQTSEFGDSWKVILENGDQRIYKGVILAIGHHWDKRFPQYDGEFSGNHMFPINLNYSQEFPYILRTIKRLTVFLVKEF
jgi:cation diffusion facilitator CzcD-associated flavoprotein CzcO